MSIKTESIKRVLRIEGRVPEETSVWLVSDNEQKPFHCLECGKFMLYRQHRIFAIIKSNLASDRMGDQTLVPSPLTIQCKYCGHVYHISIM